LLVNIYTNGIALDDNTIAKLSKLHLRSFHCSIYGSCAKIHDAITGVDGSFNKTIYVLKKMHELGTPVNMKVVLMKDNIADYDNIMNLAGDLNIPTQVSASIIPTMNGDKKTCKLRASKEDIKYVFLKESAKVQEVANRHVNIDADNICNAGFDSLAINPYGDVFICATLCNPIGNLKNTTISYLWENSPELKRWRNFRFRDIKKCSECKLLNYCTFCPGQAYLETGKWNETYEEACKLAQINYEIMNKIS
jgi:radical SAM protein with 4Fe4S-binding SPASM domain